MRPCPKCSSEIPDDAPACPECGHDFTSAEAPDALVRAGERYLLGYTEDAFGIWDREAPSTPVERFPRSDEGERAAISRFEALERPGALPPDPEVPEPSSGDEEAPQLPPGGEPSLAPGNPAAAGALAMGVVGVAAGVMQIVAVALLLGGLALVFGGLGLRASSAGAGSRGLALAGVALGLLAVIAGFFGFAASFETAIGVGRFGVTP